MEGGAGMHVHPPLSLHPEPLCSGEWRQTETEEEFYVEDPHESFHTSTSRTLSYIRLLSHL